MLKVIIGLILGLGSMYGGAYVGSILPQFHWALFPIGVTLALLSSAGWFLFIMGIGNYLKK